MRLRQFLFLLLSLLIPAAASGARKLPERLQQAVDRPANDVEVTSDDDALILHDETIVEFHANGRKTTQTFYALKILTVDGRYRGKISVSFSKGEESVKKLDAWLISPSGDVSAFRKRNFAEREGGTNALYSTERVLTLGLEQKAKPGAIIAFTSTKVVKTVFLDDLCVTRQPYPALFQRYEVRTPQDWTLREFSLRDPVVQREQESGRWSWIAVNQPASPTSEFKSPSIDDRSPLVAVQVCPSPSRRKSPFKILQDWADMAAYAASLADPAAIPDEAIRAKAAGITRGAGTPWDQLKALAAFVQSVNYVSVEIDLLRGGGLKPFDAPEVLRRHYGDCKDKTALIRALAASLGFESYAVSIRGTGKGDVDPQWPSLAQFNHAIVALRVGDDIQAPAVLEHPRLGRLLIFDPTDDLTPIGYLNPGYSGVYMLIAAPGEEDLVKAPTQPPPAIEELFELKMLQDGSIIGRVTTRYRGGAASVRRHEHRSVSGEEFQRALQKSVASVSSRGRAVLVSFDDDFEQNVIEQRVEIYLHEVGRNLANNLWALTSAPFLRHNWRPSAQDVEKRDLPFVTVPASYTQQILIAPPAGFQPVDLPDRLVLTEPFCTFAMDYQLTDGVLDIRHATIFHKHSVPAEAFHKVKDFFDKRARAASSTILLRKPPAQPNPPTAGQNNQSLL